MSGRGLTTDQMFGQLRQEIDNPGISERASRQAALLKLYFDALVEGGFNEDQAIIIVALYRRRKKED